VGCGVCEMICPASEPALVIDYNNITPQVLSVGYLKKSQKGGH
jgi:formate hydrogenlyase subunit 6/NADH:ubiquinone oxidoreductase subunit I